MRGIQATNYSPELSPNIAVSAVIFAMFLIKVLLQLISGRYGLKSLVMKCSSLEKTSE
jgi:hypothetical protein